MTRIFRPSWFGLSQEAPISVGLDNRAKTRALRLPHAPHLSAVPVPQSWPASYGPRFRSAMTARAASLAAVWNRASTL
jgi:hypothetical protein